MRSTTIGWRIGIIVTVCAIKDGVLRPVIRVYNETAGRHVAIATHCGNRMETDLIGIKFLCQVAAVADLGWVRASEFGESIEYIGRCVAIVTIRGIGRHGDREMKNDT